ncbi:hypothetical protein N7461_008044 [Penicillium sp. DV-2018c]|nr:hypothetical protein N7461_008044 [Penicillium sp. DV-2018c]
MSPIELPPSDIRHPKKPDKRQSHDYPNMTKGNSIQGEITQRSPHYFQPHREMQPSGGTGYRERIERKPLSNCFYGGAFPQCLT